MRRNKPDTKIKAKQITISECALSAGIRFSIEWIDLDGTAREHDQAFANRKEAEDHASKTFENVQCEK